MTDLARVAGLEASGRAALPALEERAVDGWLLRASGGTTKRVNSANPVEGGVAVLPVVQATERFYAERRLPCRFRLTPLADASANSVLENARFEVLDRSWTMVAPLVPRPAEPGVILIDRVDPAWLAAVEPLSGREAAAATVQARLLARLPGPIGLARIEEAGRVVAAGYASIGHGRAQLSDIVVAPDQRGRGHGRRLVTALLGWAQDSGCREAMLQVLAINAVARRLYASLGFTDAYPYHYRVRR